MMLPKFEKLKIELSNSFAMKDLGSVKKNLGMKIIHDKKKK